MCKNLNNYNNNSFDGRKKSFNQMHLESNSEDDDKKEAQGLRRGFCYIRMSSYQNH